MTFSDLLSFFNLKNREDKSISESNLKTSKYNLGNNRILQTKACKVIYFVFSWTIKTVHSRDKTKERIAK